MKNSKLTQEKLLEDIAFISIATIEIKTDTLFKQKQQIVDAIIDTLREELDLSKYDLPNLLTTFK